MCISSILPVETLPVSLDQDPQLIIIRGLPGSGKTTLARQIARSCRYVHFENDMYFETDGVYRYDRALLTAAQQWCYRSARDALLSGAKVVVSNCFIHTSHMQDFFALTDRIAVIECKFDYGNVHQIPDEVLSSMRERWEPFPGALQL